MTTFTTCSNSARAASSNRLHDATLGRRRNNALRSRSVIPPHTPNSILLSNESARHSVRTGHAMQTAFARFWAAPYTNIASGSAVLHAPLSPHDLSLILGFLDDVLRRGWFGLCPGSILSGTPTTAWGTKAFLDKVLLPPVCETSAWTICAGICTMPPSERSCPGDKGDSGDIRLSMWFDFGTLIYGKYAGTAIALSIVQRTTFPYFASVRTPALITYALN